MKITGKTLADRLKYARSQAGLTQAELAERAEVPFPSYQAIEYGKVTNPGVQTVASIAKSLEISIEKLTGLGTVAVENEEPDTPFNSESIAAYIRRLEESAKLAERLRKRHPAQVLEFLSRTKIDWDEGGPLISDEWPSPDSPASPKKKSRRAAR